MDCPSGSNQRTLKTKGRWAITKTTIALENGLYVLAASKNDIEDRILDWLRENPRATKNDVRNGVGGKGTAIDTALAHLIEGGVIANKGTAAKHSYAVL